MSKVQRIYYTSTNDLRGSSFTKVGKDLWSCDRGAWVGEVRDNNQLTLHHDMGKADYVSYKDIITEN